MLILIQILARKYETQDVIVIFVGPQALLRSFRVKKRGRTLF